ncbi:DUF397 domain-containing protein [Streptomyces sp. H27-C3]|uniref:DUF397 domain-containing protein n=1 Tax=Streptomyces sp. H27-C3 TaxID=3046305 RepID=UPI0024B90C10|nr:DUF397 domain-containing protein [Streptomyces sp. H27-C3]MDJ0460463.1 DUF397 domain-containing protein [Streptomyces sp. H27-C3]
MHAARADLSNATWRKTAYSNGQGGDCVEFADNVPGLAPVRDSKNPTGPVLVFPADAWAAFVDRVKAAGI